MEKGIKMLWTRRLPLEGGSNMRDLGGYPLKMGGLTKFGVFVRSARPCHLSDRDKALLKDYGLKVSLDFHSESEAAKWPSDFIQEPWIEYRLMSLDVHHVIIAEEGESPIDGREHMTWPEVYVMMLERYKPWFKDVLDAAAECEGILHYHCTTGKDRTGLISALLLGLAGAYEEDIIEDYAISEMHLEPVFLELIENSVKWASSLTLDNVFFKTAPQNMQAVLKYLNETYGGARGYAENIGVSKENIEKIITKFTERQL